MYNIRTLILWLASFPGLRNLRGWEMKAWYTLFAHAPDITQNLCKPCYFRVFITSQIQFGYGLGYGSAIALQLSPSEVPSFTECVSYTWNTVYDWHCSESRASIFNECCKWLYYLSTNGIEVMRGSAYVSSHINSVKYAFTVVVYGVTAMLEGRNVLAVLGKGTFYSYYSR